MLTRRAARWQLQRRLRHVMLLVGLAAAQISVPAQSAHAAGCTETTKFVREHNANPSTGFVQYPGNRGSAWAYDYSPICSGGSVANSFFMRLSADYTNFVETGTQQNSQDASSNNHPWAEWRYYPAPAQPHYYDSIFNTSTAHRYESANRNGSGTSWDLFIRKANSGDAFTHLANTGNLAAFTGVPESEFSRYGNARLANDVDGLLEQDDFGGTWSDWQNMSCDYSQDFIIDALVFKESDQDWFLTTPADANTSC